MSGTTLPLEMAATLRGLLTGIVHGVGAPLDVRDDASFWSLKVHPDIAPADLQVIAWVLHDATGGRRVPVARRDRAHLLAAYLEERAMGVGSPLGRLSRIGSLS